jgi:mannose-6-phosphate isomerase-like protein (cupin superfamily)
MNLSNINDKNAFFQVLQTSKKSQTATMTLAPGKSSGPKINEHPKSEQVLLVLEGELLAEIGDEKTTLRKGDVVIVPINVPHRFTNKAASPAKTFNVYAPPGYDPDERN